MLRRLFKKRASERNYSRNDALLTSDPYDDLLPHAKSQARWMLADYGVNVDNQQFQTMTTDQLLERASRKREAFQQRELAWWKENITTTERAKIGESIERFSLGGAPSCHFVSRASGYSGFSGYRDIPIQTSRKLTDRGLAVSRDPLSRHFILLSAIKSELVFELSLDEQSQSRLITHAHSLRQNRDAAKAAMGQRWSKTPTNYGEEYDEMSMRIAERKITYIYRQRDNDSSAIDRTIIECREMIQRSSEFIASFAELGRSLPSHKGYKQLAIILDKKGRMEEAIDVCQAAQLEGWADDWARRIERYERKLQKQRGKKNP